MHGDHESEMDDALGGRLDEHGEVLLALLEYRMVAADVAAERSQGVRRSKLAERDRIVSVLVDQHTEPPVDAAPWRHELADALRVRDPGRRRAALAAAAKAATGRVTDRQESLAMVVELATSSPWPEGTTWNGRARAEVLAQIADELPGIDAEDLREVEKEVADQLRAMRRARSSWKRAAVVGVVGVGLGAATMGVAAPAVGAVIGATFGLTGAAATSAGLATLGGGALAAGGYGVGGGTAVLVGAGGIVGAGLGAGGARVAGRLRGDLARTVVRAEVHARIVLIGERRDDDAARRVVVAMERRLDEVTEALGELGTRLRELAREKTELQDAAERDRAEIRTLVAENDALRRELEAERDRTALAEVALTTSVRRLSRLGVAGDAEAGATEQTEITAWATTP